MKSLKARSNNLLVHDVGAETVVYDRDQQVAHRLNETATAVWQRLDGETSVAEIASGLRCDMSVVTMAIDYLQEAKLLEAEAPSFVSRRSAVRKVAGLAAAGLLLPVVSSIAAPTPAMAQSGVCLGLDDSRSSASCDSTGDGPSN